MAATHETEKRWRSGEVIVRREVLNDGRAWLEVPVIVVEDSPELLVTYIAGGAPFRFPPGPWPTPTGLHPWHGKERWHGHGVLMLQRPGEAYAVWVFWWGPERKFRGWYLNLQQPFRRTAIGYDTQDLELDIWVPAEGPWQWKDDDVLEDRVREGRYTQDQIDATRAEGRRIAAELDAGRRWWSDEWAAWNPDPDWPLPDFLPERLTFVLSDVIWEESAAAFEEHERRIRARLPDVEVRHTGGTSVRGALTSGDVDLQVRTGEGSFVAARDTLSELYAPLHPEAWHSQSAYFVDAGSEPRVEVALTATGTLDDLHHGDAWRGLAADPKLLERYNELKRRFEGSAALDEYEAAKRDFFYERFRF